MTTLANKYAQAHAELEDEVFSGENTPLEVTEAGKARDACLPYMRGIMRTHASIHGYASAMRMVRLACLGVMAVLGCEEELLGERKRR